MITTRQIDAGLALLGLNRSDMAASLGINKSTLNAYFTGQSSIPSGKLEIIQKWLENSGIVFIDDEGVKLNKSEIVKYEGETGFRAFMDDVYETIKATPGEYYVSNVNEQNWLRWLGEEDALRRRKRTTALKGVHARILVKENDTLLTATDYAEYRHVPDTMFMENLSHYIYGDKLALIEFKEDTVSVLVLHNADFAKAQKIWFETIWKQAEKA
ncbi:MAG: hypothetical protein EOM12_10375 [Verrucomicrobiae bacterium]|nr:hypothetical protein [Verrucomicrobiae bacterium]